MHRIFRTNHPAVYLSLLLLAVLCNFHLFLLPREELAFSLADNVYFTLQSAWWVNLLTVVFIYSTAMIFNQMAIDADLANRQSYLPTAMFILMSPVFQGIGSAHMAAIMCIFLSLFLFKYLTVEEGPKADNSTFFSAFFISLASLFKPALLPVALFPLLYLYQLNVQGLKRALMYFIVLFFPYYFLWTVAFLNNQGTDFLGNILSGIHFSFDKSIPLDWALLLPALPGYLIFRSNPEFLINKKRKWYSFWFLFGLILLLFSLFSSPREQLLCAAALPLSFFGAQLFEIERRQNLLSLLFLILVLSRVYWQLETAGLIPDW